MRDPACRARLRRDASRIGVLKEALRVRFVQPEQAGRTAGRRHDRGGRLLRTVARSRGPPPGGGGPQWATEATGWATMRHPDPRRESRTATVGHPGPAGHQPGGRGHGGVAPLTGTACYRPSIMNGPQGLQPRPRAVPQGASSTASTLSAGAALAVLTGYAVAPSAGSSIVTTRREIGTPADQQARAGPSGTADHQPGPLGPALLGRCAA